MAAKKKTAPEAEVEVPPEPTVVNVPPEEEPFTLPEPTYPAPGDDA